MRSWRCALTSAALSRTAAPRAGKGDKGGSASYDSDIFAESSADEDAFSVGGYSGKKGDSGGAAWPKLLTAGVVGDRPDDSGLESLRPTPSCRVKGEMSSSTLSRCE